jgi:uncharacterized spore protein YtfJ
LKRILVLLTSAALICGSVAMAQKPAEKGSSPKVPPGAEFVDGLAQRLSQELHVKTVVGEPIKAGAVTLIPILMLDVNFAGGAMSTPAAGAPEASGFLMSGEARPLGFVAITKNGTRFISVAKTPAK